MLRLTRYWLPGAVVLGGIVVMAARPSDDSNLLGGAGIIGAGLAIWLLNWLYRIGAAGDVEREREDAARAFFDRHGRWPDDPPPPDPHRVAHRTSPHRPARR